MNALVTDSRHALRVHARTPVTSLIAVAALAVATAFDGAFLSLYIGLVAKPHPGFEDSEQLLRSANATARCSMTFPID